MDTHTYATDLSDAQRVLRPLVEPPARLSRSGRHAPRTALNALPCVLRIDCS
jgi:hypothetical protein